MGLDRTTFCNAMQDLRDFSDKIDKMTSELRKVGLTINSDFVAFEDIQIVLRVLAASHGTMGYQETLDILEWAVYEQDFLRKTHSGDITWEPEPDIKFNIAPVNFIELYRYLDEDFNYNNNYFEWRTRGVYKG